VFDALQSTIVMCLKCKEVTNPPTQVNWINDDSKVAFKLLLFATNIKKEICDVLVSSISFFLKLYEERKFDMLCLMLDPKFKSLCLILYFIGGEEKVNIVEDMIF
jgi:hypothetical protein